MPLTKACISGQDIYVTDALDDPSAVSIRAHPSFSTRLDRAGCELYISIEHPVKNQNQPERTRCFPYRKLMVDPPDERVLTMPQYGK
jgi:hypothetical protein